MRDAQPRPEEPEPARLEGAHPGHHHGVERERNEHDAALPGPVDQAPEAHPHHHRRGGIRHEEAPNAGHSELEREGLVEGEHRAQCHADQGDRRRHAQLSRAQRHLEQTGHLHLAGGGRPPVAQPAREPGADEREHGGGQERRGPAHANRDLFRRRRGDRVHREEGEAEQADRLAEPLGRRLVDGERRACDEGHREGHPLHRAQHVQEGADAVHAGECERGDGHQDRAGGEEIPPAEAIDQHTHRRQEDDDEETVERGDLPDLGRPGAELRHQELRQQEVVREGVAEARLRGEQLRETGRQQSLGPRIALRFQHVGAGW